MNATATNQMLSRSPSSSIYYILSYQQRKLISYDEQISHFFSSVQRKRLIDFDNRRRTALSHTLRPKCEAPFRKGQQKNINLCLYCIYHSMHSSIAFIRHRSRTSLVVSFFRFPRPPASSDLSRRRPTIFFSLVLSLSVFSFV